MYSMPVITTRLAWAYSIVCFLVQTTASSLPGRTSHEDDTTSRLTEHSAGGAMDQSTLLPFDATDASLDLLADLCNKMGSRHLLDSSYSPSYEEGPVYVDELGTTANVSENKMDELHERVFKAVLGLCISIVLLVTVSFIVILICIRRHGWHRKRRAAYMREESILMPRRAV